MSELKPCPFCSGSDIEGPHMTEFVGDTRAPYVWIECQGCYCYVSVPGECSTPVVSLWNTRADSALVERIENLLIEIYSGFIDCWDEVEGYEVGDGVDAALKVVSERLRSIIDEHKEGCRGNNRQ